ncbi:glutamyl-tRNA(Gln) amidotransferase subunit A, mitochondrial [Leptopilina boulardi]|uniref:glutamyl-tRNA(Gln) amidotransferase subunit A, mitochondrial n=1 Tax=Leptopilina boulardi TaxID=63433 RepID=UPI0021F64F9E|nr:glutamyl-tRNA(Gln) amidotransferase subunit A, mitochondrial [Leptopilina boulardi]
MNKILFSPIKEVSKKINTGEINPSDILNSSLKLIDSVKSLNAYISLTSKLDENKEFGNNQQNEKLKNKDISNDLYGIPIAIKDNFCTQDHLTTCGSLMLANFIPGYDATVCSRLKKSGAILIGKTNLDQFAMGCGTVDSFFGPTKNIWGCELMEHYFCEKREISKEKKNSSSNEDDWHIAGGSSGGSAVAVASGTCYAALGSDSGGSTRNPAAYCGLIGLKPTYGLVSRHGLIPLVNSMDVPGILTRHVDDALIVLNAIAGPDSADSTTLKREYQPISLPENIDVSGLRIGIPKEYQLKNLSNEVNECWQNVARILEEAGAKIISVSLPHTEFSIVCYSVLNKCEVASNMARYDGIEFGYRANETFSTEELFAKTRSTGFNDVVKSRILAGNYFLLSENYENYFVKAMKVRRLIAEDFNALWNMEIDLLLTPTTLSDAPMYRDFIKADNQTQCSMQDYFTQPANMAGLPAINIPVSISKKGLPLSLQLMAANLEERKLLTVAKWIEESVQFPKLTLRDMSLC